VGPAITFEISYSPSDCQLERGQDSYVAPTIGPGTSAVYTCGPFRLNL
jgi:hypothetical protein